jgi:hypothetical protein
MLFKVIDQVAVVAHTLGERVESDAAQSGNQSLHHLGLPPVPISLALSCRSIHLSNRLQLRRRQGGPHVVAIDAVPQRASNLSIATRRLRHRTSLDDRSG